MRPSQYRHNSLYLATEDDSYVTQDAALTGFTFEADAWTHIRPDGTFIHRATRAGYDGFAWDGCSPKFHVGPLAFGTWDGHFIENLKKPQAIRAAKFHDALYQELDQLREIGFERKHADLLFKEMLTDAAFAYPDVYYWAVRAFGGVNLRVFRIRNEEKS